MYWPEAVNKSGNYSESHDAHDEESLESLLRKLVQKVNTNELKYVTIKNLEDKVHTVETYLNEDLLPFLNELQ